MMHYMPLSLHCLEYRYKAVQQELLVDLQTYCCSLPDIPDDKQGLLEIADNASYTEKALADTALPRQIKGHLVKTTQNQDSTTGIAKMARTFSPYFYR